MIKLAGTSRCFWGLMVLVLIAVLSINGNLQASTVIDTTPSWDGTSYIHPFGYPDTATYGQTFTVGSDNVLNDFAFWLDTTETVYFGAYVAAWDGNKAVGPILFDSGMLDNLGPAGLQEIYVSTGNLALTTGQQYVAFFSISNYFALNDTWTTMGFVYSDVYAGGGFFYFNNQDDFSALTTTNWDDIGIAYDAAFKANFSAIPIPGAVWLLGSGLLGLIGLRRRLLR